MAGERFHYTMSDIVERLRSWVYTDALYRTAIEAAEEIERLNRKVDAARLTDAEREAIWTAAEAYAENDGDPECAKIAAALQGLWQRTK